MLQVINTGGEGRFSIRNSLKEDQVSTLYIKYIPSGLVRAATEGDTLESPTAISLPISDYVL